MKGKIVLITGATAGIGKSAALALAKTGATVVIHGRDVQKTQMVCDELRTISGNNDIHFFIADLFLQSEVRKLASDFHEKYNNLDILVNNAGCLMGSERQETPEGIEKTIALNLFAPFLLTALLLDLLKKSPDGRVINVSSNSHQLNAKPDFSDLELKKMGYNPLRAYGNTKLFLIWMTQLLAEQMRSEQIDTLTVNSMHPGAIATTFGVESDLGAVLNFLAKLARPFFKSAEQGADTIIYLATSNEVKSITGKYFVNRKQTKVAGKYYTVNNAMIVRDYCEQHTRIEIC